jgi:hypothetical protein
VPLTGPAFASRAAENAQGPGQLELGDSLDGSRCLLSPWAPPPTEKAIFARGSSGTSPPHGGKFENHARWREILTERREESSEREGTGRRMLAAATAAYGYFNPALLPTPHSPPASSRLPDLARSAPVASQFGSSHTS